MRSTSSSKLIVGALAAASLSLAACQTDDSTDQPPAATAAAVAVKDTSHTHVDSAAGDVARDSTVAAVTGKWITDANILSLLSTMTSRQIAAADAELQAWHSDTVRAFAASVARESAEIQHSVDSVSGRIHLAPIAPALAAQIADTMLAFSSRAKDKMK